MAETSDQSTGTRDQRSEPRTRTLLSGAVIEADGAYSTACTIRDVSPSGAKLRLPGPIPMNEKVFLLEMRSGAARRVRVAWRRNTDVGVAYESAVSLEEARDPAARMLRRMWQSSAC